MRGERKEHVELETQLTSLPAVTFDACEVILAAGSTSAPLLFLKESTVEVVKDGVRISRVAERGAVFGEMSALLDQPRTADVRTLAPSTFHVVEAAHRFLKSDPAAAHAVAVVLTQRLDALIRYLVDVRNQFREFEDHVGMIDEVIDPIVNKHPRKVERRAAGS